MNENEKRMRNLKINDNRGLFINNINREGGRGAGSEKLILANHQSLTTNCIQGGVFLKYDRDS